MFSASVFRSVARLQRARLMRLNTLSQWRHKSAAIQDALRNNESETVKRIKYVGNVERTLNLTYHLRPNVHCEGSTPSWSDCEALISTLKLLDVNDKRWRETHWNGRNECRQSQGLFGFILSSELFPIALHPAHLRKARNPVTPSTSTHQNIEIKSVQCTHLQ